ncbi:UNVERIFIED_CONTAM: hypothetical protein Sradi_7282300 [Sesamum radiatum]|uniref:Uncharacterized protein n=1 Tax=Sesamum radiatum TaxID=300843 RepID=A0AAW2II19_SESRA
MGNKKDSLASSGIKYAANDSKEDLDSGTFVTLTLLSLLSKHGGSYRNQHAYLARLIEKGCRWLVGDGRSIGIWHDRWVPREYMFKVISPPSILDRHATVSQLISDSGREWKEDLVRETFHPNEANTSLSMPLGRGTTDTLIRHRCKKLAEGESKDSLQLIETTGRYCAAFKEANEK